MSEPLSFLANLRRSPARWVKMKTSTSGLSVSPVDPVNSVIHRFLPPISGEGVAPRFSIGLKDIFQLPGRTPLGGSGLVHSDMKIGAVVERLLVQGASIEVLLNLDELAAGGTGENIHHGRCLNPWNPKHLTGGSSGGSAAAVAAGVVPVSLGSDAGGSIRIPAAWCGVTGHKPTYGRVSRAGALARGWTVDCIGPFAQSAASCASVLAIVEGSDPDDPSTWCPPVQGAALQPSHLKIGYITPSARDCDPETLEALESAAQELSRSGISIGAVDDPDYDTMNTFHQIIVRAEAAALNGAACQTNPGKVAPAIAGALNDGLSITAEQYLSAQRQRADLLLNLDDVFQGKDLLLLPVTPTPAPHIKAARDPARFHADARYTRFANFLGLPATAFPTGESKNGLPLSAQLVGRPFEDSLCLAAADAFQSRTAHHLLKPS